MKIKFFNKIVPQPLKKLVLKYTCKPVINYYKTDFKKNVLLSYIVAPFKSDSPNYTHTNFNESIIIAEVFRDLGFNVDVYNYDLKVK